MNINDVLVLDDAYTDLKEGKLFYDKKQLGIGEYFWDSLVSDIESLIMYAGIHSKKYKLFRMFSKRFPYAIYYQTKNQTAYVIAVLPMHRDPTWIIKKLNKAKI